VGRMSRRACFARMAAGSVAVALGMAQLRRALAMGTGLLSLGLGVYLAFQIGFGDGLFLGAPVWIPR